MIEKYFSVGHQYQSCSFVLCQDTMFSPLHFVVVKCGVILADALKMFITGLP